MFGLSKASRNFGARALALMPLLWLSTSVATAQVVGDANGDGAVTMADAAFVTAAIDGGSAQAQPFALSDVAHPCDGAIDYADLSLIERAARAGRRSLPVFSVCHGGSLGEFVPTAAGTGDPVTLDEQFLAVAALVPEFGGVYFDANGKPTLVLTSGELSVYYDAVAAVVTVFGYDRFNTDQFEVVEGQYDFRKLHDLREIARGLLLDPGVSAIDTHEVLNRLWIGLRDKKYQEDIETKLKSLGVPSEAVVLEVVGEYRADQGGFDQLERPVVGGIIASGCTVGPIVQRAGVRGFLTNSHCSTFGVVTGYPVHQDQNLGSITLIGTESVDPPLFSSAENSDCPSASKLCRYSDAAFIQVGFTAGTRRGSIKNSYSPASLPNRFVQSIALAPMCGDSIRKSGGATGVTKGKIINTCSDVTGGQGIIKLCSYVSTMGRGSGDSGSPVYATAGPAKATLYGMHWGGTTTTAVFSPLSGILAEVGAMNFLHVEEPPIVIITSPKENSVVGSGSGFSVVLTATVNDFEDGLDCTGCSVKFSSSKDGDLATVPVVEGVATFQAYLYGQGGRSITAQAFDSAGAWSTDSVMVTTEDKPANIWIDQPASNAQLPLGVGVTFSGSSFDSEAFSPLPCSSLSWTSSVSGDPTPTGCSVLMAFSTLGPRTITLTGIDSGSLSSSAQRTVVVVATPTTGAPLLTMIFPQVNSLLAREQFHPLSAVATDPDGKTPIQYEWILKGPGLIGAVNGEVTIGVTSGDNGVSTTVQWKPSDFVPSKCGGIVLDVELRATDTDNEVATMTREITVSGPLC